MFSPFKRYICWRHSKGFGVHSPYAYKFVTDVLKPGRYGYYAYLELGKRLEGKEHHDYKLQNLVKFTIRLAVFLGAKKILWSANSRFAQLAALSLKLKGKDLNHVNLKELSSSDLLAIEGSFSDITLLKRALDNGITIFALNPSHEIRTLLETPLTSGVLFKDRNSLILIPRPEMAYVSYPIFLHH